MCTSTALTIHAQLAESGDLALSSAQRLLDAFLSGRSPQTIRAYRQDLKDFREFMQADSVEVAIRPMLAGEPGAANELALRYKADLMGRDLAPTTINRRLVLNQARLVDVMPVSIAVSQLRQRGCDP